MSKINRFPLPVRLEFINEGVFRLTAPFEYHSKKYGIIKVPVEFISDGASMPQFAYSLIGGRWTGKYVSPSIIHDWLYFAQLYTRRKTDKIFLIAMKDAHVSFWKRRLMWTAVRVGGWISWNKRKKKINVDKI